MNINELIKNRESCRGYASTQVSLDQLKALVEVARLAPSAANTQPWKFYVSNDPQVVGKIAEGCMPLRRNGFAASAPAFVVMTKGVETEPWVPKGPYNHYYRDFDCGSAAMHICFAATEMGLSTCMLGWFDGALVQQACGYGDDETAIIVFTVGYAENDELRPKTRNSLEEILTVVGSL